MQESNQCLKNPLLGNMQCMSKTKIVENFTVQSVSDFGTKPSSTVWFLRNCGIAQNSSCRIAQNLSFAKTE